MLVEDVEVVLEVKEVELVELDVDELELELLLDVEVVLEVEVAVLAELDVDEHEVELVVDVEAVLEVKVDVLVELDVDAVVRRRASSMASAATYTITNSLHLRSRGKLHQ